MRKFSLFLALFFAIAMTTLAQSYNYASRLTSDELMSRTETTLIAIKNVSGTNSYWMAGTSNTATFSSDVVFEWVPVVDGQAGSYYLRKLDGNYLQNTRPITLGDQSAAQVFTTVNVTQSGTANTYNWWNGDSGAGAVDDNDTEEYLVRFLISDTEWLNCATTGGNPTYNSGPGGFTIHNVYAVEVEGDGEGTQEPVVSLTSEDLGTNVPYMLSDEDAAKVFELDVVTVVAKVTTGTLSGRGTIMCVADPSKAVNTETIYSDSYYVAVGNNNQNIGYLASAMSGQHFTTGEIPNNTEGVVLGYVIDGTANNFKSYINGTQIQNRNFGSWIVTTPKMVKEDWSDANIYIGAGMTSAGAHEAFDGTVTAIKFYSGELTAEQIANAFADADGEGTLEPVTPTALADFNPNKYYTVSTTTRGGWAVMSAGTGGDMTFCSTNDAGNGTTVDADNVNHRFAVLSADGENYYLYSLGAEKFVKADRSLVAGIADAIEFVDASSVGANRVRVNFKGIANSYINLGGSNQMTVDSWGTIDVGNAVQFLESGDFDSSAALAMLQNVAEITYNFVYGGQVRATQTVVCTVGEAYPAFDTATLTIPYGVTATVPSGTVTGDETVTVELTVGALPFEYVAEGEPTTWYYAQMHPNYPSYIINQGIGNVLPYDTSLSVEEGNEDAYTWGFVGDLWTGFKMVNRAGGAIKSTGSGNVTMADVAEGTAFIVMHSTAANDGFCMLNATAGQYMNAQTGGINHWGAADAGSTIRLTEREIPLDPIVVNAYIPAESELTELSEIMIEFSDVIAGTYNAESENQIVVMDPEGNMINCSFTVNEKVLTVTLPAPATASGEYCLAIPAGVITRVADGSDVTLLPDAGTALWFTVKQPLAPLAIEASLPAEATTVSEITLEFNDMVYGDYDEANETYIYIGEEANKCSFEVVDNVVTLSLINPITVSGEYAIYIPEGLLTRLSDHSAISSTDGSLKVNFVAPLTVVGVTPTDAVASLDVITVEFSDAIAGTFDIMNMDQIYLGTRDNGCSFSIEGNILTITPFYAITAAGEYALKIPSGLITRVADGSAVTMAGEYVFTVEEPAAPETSEATLALIVEAKDVLTIEGLGYPADAPRATLQAAIETAEAAPTAEAGTVLEAAIAAYYAATEIVLPEAGKTYTFTAIGTDVELYLYNNNGTLDLAENVGEDLPETAHFVCEIGDNGKYYFKNGEYYLAYPTIGGKDWLNEESVTGLETEKLGVTEFDIVKILAGGNVSTDNYSLFGLVAFKGLRGIRVDNGADEPGYIVVKHSANTFDGAGAPFFNENFTSAFRIDEVEVVEPETPVIAQTAVFDFANNEFGVPSFEETNYSGVKSATVLTDGTRTIEIDPTANGGQFYYDNAGYLRIQKPGTTITLPAFAFDVEKIEVVGHSSCTYANVDMNIYVDGAAVSTACVGSTGTNVFEIAESAQAAGNIYELTLGSNGGNYSSIAYITYIKVYPKVGLQAPVFDVESGVYTQPFTVTVVSPTVEELDGVENVTYYYTLDGNMPTTEDDETTGEIEVTESCTVNVIVEFDYYGNTYVSEATSAVYVISDAVTYNRAVAVEAGSYFLVADGNLAGHYVNNTLPAVEATVEGDQLTDAVYYAVTLERAADGEYYNGAYYIKDGAGNYLYTSSMYGTSGPKLQSNAAYVPTNSWTIEVAEDGTATISCEGILLVYDAAAGAFKVCLESDMTSDMVKPVFYGVYATGIEGITVGENDIESIYDLDGRKLEKVAAPGIYIVNGKKVLVK